VKVLKRPKGKVYLKKVGVLHFADLRNGIIEQSLDGKIPTPDFEAFFKHSESAALRIAEAIIADVATMTQKKSTAKLLACWKRWQVRLTIMEAERKIDRLCLNISAG